VNFDNPLLSVKIARSWAPVSNQVKERIMFRILLDRFLEYVNMGREIVNEKPQIAYAGVGVVVLLFVWIIWPSRGGSYAGKPVKVAEAFFSADDGQHWFKDDRNKIPPWQDSKEVDRAYVFDCDGNVFVGYLERLTSAGKEVAESYLGHHPSTGIPEKWEEMNIQPEDIEVKKPGEKNKWIARNDPKVDAVLKVKCPGNPKGEPKLVVP
jgi:hypothetical protein